MQPVLLATASPSSGHFPEAVGRGKNREGRREDKWQSNEGQLIYCSQIFLLKVAILWLSETLLLQAGSRSQKLAAILAQRLSFSLHGTAASAFVEQKGVAVFVIIPDPVCLLPCVEAKGKKHF